MVSHIRRNGSDLTSRQALLVTLCGGPLHLTESVHPWGVGTLGQGWEDEQGRAVHLDSSINRKPYFSGPATSPSVANFSSNPPLPAPAPPAFEPLKRNDSIRTIQAKELPPFLSLACSSLWPRITAYTGSFDPTERLEEGVLTRLKVSLSASALEFNL